MVGRLYGQYRLDELLGRGGMGEVYRAFDTRRNRTVALKILRADLGNDEAFRARFRREGQVAAQLQEPHVVPIHDFGEIDGTLFIDMRLVQGQDAAEMLDRDGPMPVNRAVGVITQVAEALDAAHIEGVVHRDVKPPNVLITPSGFVYLVDFGIARARLEGAETALTATGTAVGTLLYMAPEQFEGTPVDGLADVYALTCVLYELITGEPPFRGGSLPALMQAHLNAPPPRGAADRPGIPPRMDEVIARGMAKRPQDRFATAGELARAAQEVLSPVPNPMAHTAPVEVAAPPRRRPRRGVLIACAVVLTAAAAVTVALVAVSGSGTGRPAADTAAPTSAAPRAASDRFLITSLDSASLYSCASIEPDSFATNATASVRCLNSGVEPVGNITLRRFASRAELDTQLRRESRPTATGTADYAQNCRDGALVDVWERGRVVCRTDPNGQQPLRIAWTFDEELVLAYIDGTSADVDWWLGSASVLR